MCAMIEESTHIIKGINKVPAAKSAPAVMERRMNRGVRLSLAIQLGHLGCVLARKVAKAPVLVFYIVGSRWQEAKNIPISQHYQILVLAETPNVSVGVAAQE